jgi:hypothetical protein
MRRPAARGWKAATATRARSRLWRPPFSPHGVLDELITAASGTAPECLAQFVCRCDRGDLAPQFTAVDVPGPPRRRNEECRYRPEPSSRIRLWHSPGVAALGTGSRIFPNLPWEPQPGHAHLPPRQRRVYLHDSGERQRKLAELRGLQSAVAEHLLSGRVCPYCGTVTFAEAPPSLHAGSVSYARC